MFCGGKKKKEKELKGQAPQHIDISDPNTCKAHKQPYDSISLESSVTSNRRMCAQCRGVYKGQKVEYKTLTAQIQQQVVSKHKQYKSTFELVQSLSRSVTKDWDREWRETIVDRIRNLKNIIIQFEEQLLQNFLLKAEAPKCFTHHDLNMLVDTHVIQGLEDLTEQNKSLAQQDEDIIYVMAKMVAYPSETSSLINLLEKDVSLLQNQMKKVQGELQQKIEAFEKSLQSVSFKYQQAASAIHDPVFDFIDRAKQQTSNDSSYLQKVILRSKVSEGGKTSDVEHLQIKSICQLNEHLLVYATNLNHIHLVKLPELQWVQMLEEDGDVTALCAATIKEELHLVVGIEESGGMISIWNLNTLQKLNTFQAHGGYIWRIIQLPQSRIATCSEDMHVKVFNLETRKELIQIQIHQGCVNDIALVSTKLIASVADDLLLVLSDYETGEIQGMATDECEIKCVAGIDGAVLVTGNANGVVKVYSIHSIQVLNQLKLHDSLIRNLSRVSPKMVVTSSWDGTHAFYNIDTAQQVKKIEGPKKNFSEALLWVPSLTGFLAGSAGQLAFYK